jgi:hypothetical protein
MRAKIAIMRTNVNKFFLKGICATTFQDRKKRQNIILRRNLRVQKERISLFAKYTSRRKAAVTESNLTTLEI